MIDWLRTHPRLVLALTAAAVGIGVLATMQHHPTIVSPQPSASPASRSAAPAPTPAPTTTTNQATRTAGRSNILLSLKAVQQETSNDPTGHIAKNIPGDPTAQVTPTETLLMNAKKRFDACYTPDNADIYSCAKQLPMGVWLGRFNGQEQQYELTAKESANRTLVLASNGTGVCRTIAEHRATSCNEW